MNKETKLLPCPFCGGDAEKDYGIYEGWETEIGCTSCQVSVKDNDPDAALAKWNTRTQSEVTDEQVADFVNAIKEELIPEGWQLVPVEPTMEIINAMDNAYKRALFIGDKMPKAYVAGLQAAPKFGEVR